MKLIQSFPTRAKDSLCEAQLEVIQSLANLLESVELPKNSREGSTNNLRSQIDNQLQEHGWLDGYLIDAQISTEYPTANFNLDLSLDQARTNCVHKHRYFIEFCFDNRQAIGTNLLKFEVGALNAATQNWHALPILVCATSQAIKDFGWDGGVGSYQEYDHAIRVPYKNVLKNPPVLLAVF